MALNIKYGVSTWLWTSPFNRDTVALFPKIKAMGYDVVEIPVEDPSLIDGKNLKEALDANGLEGLVCGAFGPTRDLTHDDPQYHQNSIEYITECFRISEAIGCRFVSGPMYSAVGKARLVSPEQKKIEWERAVVNLRKVCALAEQHGQTIALEPINRFETDLINNSADVMQLIGDINHPAAQVSLDGFHMNIEEPDIEKAIILVGDKLRHVQVSENYRGTPGTGQTRWDAFYRGLSAINYQGTVAIESFTPNVKELAGAVCIWRPLAASQDGFASEGIQFLKQWAKGKAEAINEDGLLNALVGK